MRVVDNNAVHCLPALLLPDWIIARLRQLPVQPELETIRASLDQRQRSYQRSTAPLSLVASTWDLYKYLNNKQLHVYFICCVWYMTVTLTSMLIHFYIFWIDSQNPICDIQLVRAENIYRVSSDVACRPAQFILLHCDVKRFHTFPRLTELTYSSFLPRVCKLSWMYCRPTFLLALLQHCSFSYVGARTSISVILFFKFLHWCLK